MIIIVIGICIIAIIIITITIATIIVTITIPGRRSHGAGPAPDGLQPGDAAPEPVSGGAASLSERDRWGQH